MKGAFPIDDFLQKACEDVQLLPSHLTLFMTIFYYSPEVNPHGQFRVTRKKLLNISKIKSKTTYHKFPLRRNWHNKVKITLNLYRSAFQRPAHTVIRTVRHKFWLGGTVFLSKETQGTMIGESDRISRI